MLGKLKKNNQGFTIIEVLIVLAIAGLIMLIVFLAIPALQRNQRNNARNSEAARISTAISECLANRNGQKASCDTFGNPTATPPVAGEVLPGQMQQFTLPTGTFTDSSSTNTGSGSTTTVVVAYQRSCTADGADDAAGGTRDYVVLYQLEPAINRCIGSQS